MTILIKPNILLRLLLCFKSMLGTLTPQSQSNIDHPCCLINHPCCSHKSQTLSPLRSFLDSASHLYTIASYIDFSIFSKITSPSLPHLFPEVLLVIQKQTRYKLGSVLVYFLLSFKPGAQLKTTTLDLMRHYCRLI